MQIDVVLHALDAARVRRDDLRRGAGLLESLAGLRQLGLLEVVSDEDRHTQTI
jgi:hypothetical protein